MSRYFFALWPDQSIRKKIVAIRHASAVSGKLVQEKNLHITLLFMGQLNLNQVEKVISAAWEIKLNAFSIQLNKSGYFPRPRVSWLGLKSIPDSLEHLHHTICACALNSRIPVQERKYTPHLTLARKSSPLKTLSFNSIDWNIRQFVLIESTDTAQGVHYQIIAKFPLSAVGGY